MWIKIEYIEEGGPEWNGDRVRFPLELLMRMWCNGEHAALGTQRRGSNPTFSIFEVGCSYTHFDYRVLAS